jgi:hypothetical protein
MDEYAQVSVSVLWRISDLFFLGLTSVKRQNYNLKILTGFLSFFFVVNSNCTVCDQKISKLFVSHVEESMTEHMGINGVY